MQGLGQEQGKEQVGDPPESVEKSSLAPKSSKPATLSTATPVENMITHGSTLMFSFTVKKGASCRVGALSQHPLNESDYSVLLTCKVCMSAACPSPQWRPHDQ